MFKVVSKKSKTITLKYIREISPWEGRSFDQFFSEYDGKYDIIIIQLHCYGGVVFEGNLIYNILKNAQSEIHIDVIGIAASMGTIFLISGKRRRMAKNSFLMFHRVQGGAVGNALDMESAAKLMRDMEANFVTDLAAITGMTTDEVKKKWFSDSSDHWINAQEALDLNLVHELIDPVVENVNNLDNETVAKLGEKAMFGKFAAVLSIDKSKSNLNENKEMKKLLIAKYNLQGVNEESSDTAIMEAIEAKFKNQADKATEVQNELKKIKDTAINEAVEAAVKSGQIVAVEGKTIDQQKATFVSIGKSAGFEALSAALGAIKPHKTIVSSLGTGGSQGSTGTGAVVNRDGWDWDKWQKEDSAGLEALEKSDKAAFDALFNAKYKK